MCFWFGDRYVCSSGRLFPALSVVGDRREADIRVGRGYFRFRLKAEVTGNLQRAETQQFLLFASCPTSGFISV